MGDKHKENLSNKKERTIEFQVKTQWHVMIISSFLMKYIIERDKTIENNYDREVTV